MEEINYLKLALERERNDEYWYAVTKDGYTIECGFGFVPNEFNLLSCEKMDKAVLEENFDWEEEYKKRIQGKGGVIEPLSPIEDYWTLDGHHYVFSKNKKDKYLLEDIYDEEHPDEDSFRLVPKSDIVETYFVKKQRSTPKFIEMF